jgi:hypothetical protein
MCDPFYVQFSLVEEAAAARLAAAFTKNCDRLSHRFV